MTYFQKDVDAIERLRSQLESVALPFAGLRKLNTILNAIEVQIEDEHADGQVTDVLFAALLLAAERLDSPAGLDFRESAQECREHIAKRLSRRIAGGR